MGFAAVPAFALADDAVLTVSGELTYEERVALPPDSVMQVTVQDISRADARSKILADFQTEPEGVPVHFKLDVRRSELRPRGRYGLRGSIRSEDGALLWTTDTVTPVAPSAGNVDVGTVVMVRAASGGQIGPQVYRCGESAVLTAFDGDAMVLTLARVSHRLERVRTASGAHFVGADSNIYFWTSGETAQLDAEGERRECSPAPHSAFLTDGKWIVEDIDGGGVVDRSRTSMTFASNGRVAGRAGCNDYTGEWQADGTRLETSRLAQTRKACVPALGRQETTFLEILTQAERFQFTHTGALVISDAAGREVRARPQ